MTYAVKQNSEKLVSFLVRNKDVGKLNVEQKDKTGRSIAHYVVSPIRFGSYENT